MTRARLKRLRLMWDALGVEADRLGQLRELRERFPTATIEDGVTVHSPHLLEVGERAIIQRNALLHCGGYAWSNGQGGIKIGAGSSLAHDSVLWGAGTIELGRNVHCGIHTVMISSQSHWEAHPDDPDAKHWFAPIRLEDEVIIFSDVMITPGVTIGHGAVVGGKSLVLRDIPPMQFWAGTPARHIRDLDPDTRIPVQA